MNKNGERSVDKNDTLVERLSDRELLITRTFNAPARLVFQAWTTPDLLMRWWAPKSMGLALVRCEVDARKNGRYRFEFSHNGSEPFAFFGHYIDVVQDKRLSWTNEESGDGAVTTVTFDEADGKTILVHSELYPTRDALDEAFVGMESCMPEQFEQLDAVLIAL